MQHPELPMAKQYTTGQPVMPTHETRLPLKGRCDGANPSPHRHCTTQAYSQRMRLSGRSCRDRTDDILLVREALYQLS